MQVLGAGEGLRPLARLLLVARLTVALEFRFSYRGGMALRLGGGIGFGGPFISVSTSTRRSSARQAAPSGVGTELAEGCLMAILSAVGLILLELLKAALYAAAVAAAYLFGHMIAFSVLAGFGAVPVLVAQACGASKDVMGATGAAWFLASFPLSIWLVHRASQPKNRALELVTTQASAACDTARRAAEEARAAAEPSQDARASAITAFNAALRAQAAAV